MNELVQRLTNGLHRIAAERSASAQELREQIERGFVLLKFPDTRGGTELGSQLDMEQTRLEGADFEAGTGSVRLVGNLTLNYDKVQLVADIDLPSLKGTGRLVLVEEAGGAQHARNGGSADDASITAEAEAQDDAEADVSEAKLKAAPKKKKAAGAKAAQAQ